MTLITLQNQKDNVTQALADMLARGDIDQSKHDTLAAAMATKTTIPALRVWWMGLSEVSTPDAEGNTWLGAISVIKYKITYSGLTGGTLAVDDEITTDGGWKATIIELGTGFVLCAKMKDSSTADAPVVDEDFTVDGSSPSVSATIDSIETP